MYLIVPDIKLQSDNRLFTGLAVDTETCRSFHAEHEPKPGMPLRPFLLRAWRAAGRLQEDFTASVGGNLLAENLKQLQNILLRKHRRISMLQKFADM